MDHPRTLSQLDLCVRPQGHGGIEWSLSHEEVASSGQHLLPGGFEPNDFEGWLAPFDHAGTRTHQERNVKVSFIAGGRCPYSEAFGPNAVRSVPISNTESGLRQTRCQETATMRSIADGDT
jgi:hypothetical protein